MEKLTPYIDGFMKEITAIKDLTPAEQVYRPNFTLAKRGCVFLMVIWPAFRMARGCIESTTILTMHPSLDDAPSSQKMSRAISEIVISIGLIISVSKNFSFR